MRKFFKIILFLLLPIAGMAQNTVVNITPDVFNKNGQYFISTANGWLFKHGSDTAWAKKDINVNGWQQIPPISITAKDADKNGEFEGWFRLKIKIDNAFTDNTFGIKCASFAAADVYIDGKLLASYGNTGANGAPYKSAETAGHLAVPVYLKPGSEHAIAMHFVDRICSAPPFRLKSEYGYASAIISITKLGYNTHFFQFLIQDRSFETMWVSVGTVLSLLFWLLFSQNRSEKQLKLIALGTTFLTLGVLSEALSEMFGLSFYECIFFEWLNTVFIGLATIWAFLILISIFKRRLTVGMKVFLILYACFSFVANLLPSGIDSIGSTFLVSVFFVLSIYYVVSSWKDLKGPQWAIVVGVMISLLFGAVYTYIVTSSSPTLDVVQICVTGYSLSFPLSLLVYVSMRFKEIITEVRLNAAQVVQLSEEKKEVALNRQKVLQEEVNRQTAEILTTLNNLKSAQTQLIQSEKMASLGELTAGIAHEIQNPLNFVNNFSEVSVELLQELKEEAEAGNKEEVIAIANDLTQNLEKINHHGKRADFIVKGMLQHSRTSTGEKQLTNINILADEFLKLSYHGLRAKDKNFNAELLTNFDENLPKVNIAAQDIGRVLLNLFNNAFYAVNQKQKTNGGDYKPEVSVYTYFEKNNLVISVRDNGNGIPNTIKDKIMQPFFTTKPTGEGTGLGLSLSYDIVVKGHSGTINVDTKEGEFTKFTIQLPID